MVCPLLEIRAPIGSSNVPLSYNKVGLFLWNPEYLQDTLRLSHESYPVSVFVVFLGHVCVKVFIQVGEVLRHFGEWLQVCCCMSVLFRKSQVGSLFEEEVLVQQYDSAEVKVPKRVIRQAYCECGLKRRETFHLSRQTKSRCRAFLMNCGDGTS